MALQSGRYATVRVGGLSSGTIPFLGHWEIQITADSADATYFGSVWKRQMPMMMGWTGTLDGFFDNSTVSTQLILLSSGMFGGELINDMRFYIDTSSGEFFMPNFPAADSTDAGVYVNSYRVTADKAGITAISLGIIGFGPIGLFSVTSTSPIATSTM